MADSRHFSYATQVCPASRAAQEPPHGKRANVGRAPGDPGCPGEHKGDNPKHVPNEGTHELLAAVLHRPSQQGGRRPRGRAVSMQESSPADPLAGFHVTVRK